MILWRYRVWWEVGWSTKGKLIRVPTAWVLLSFSWGEGKKVFCRQGWQMVLECLYLWVLGDGNRANGRSSGRIKITVIAALVKNVAVKISNCTSRGVLTFFWWFNAFVLYRRNSKSKWSLGILEREYLLIKAELVGKTFNLSRNFLNIYLWFCWKMFDQLCLKIWEWWDTS